MGNMRRGVVLFITLSVIVAMIAMVGVIFSYLQKSRDNASYTAALIQADLLFRDGKDAIDKLLKKGSKDKDIKKTILETLYLAPMTIQSEENEDVFMTIHCQPLDNGVNINWLNLENNSSAQLHFETVQTIYNYLAEIYNIQNPALLLERIKQAVQGENIYNDDMQGETGRENGIIALSQMRSIARDYRFEADDPAVENIAWEKYFSFDPRSTVIDGNFISAELIAPLFDMEPDLVKEEWFEGDDLKKFISSNGGDMTMYNRKLFSAELIERMECRISFGYQGNVYAMGFDYLEGKAEKFEFYGKQ